LSCDVLATLTVSGPGVPALVLPTVNQLPPELVVATAL
jgi:hypothetical protein